MKKVHELIGHAEPVPGDVGIEIEVEFQDANPSVPKEISSIWSSKGDNSLRFIGREYVTNGAQPLGKELEDSLDVLCDKINKSGPVKESPRTSVHVHINVTSLPVTSLWSGVCGFWLLENLLVNYCGDHRESNLFCFRLQDTEGILRYVEKDLKSSKPFGKHLNTDHVRYAALNLNAIAKFGSVESRSMRGITDAKEIYDWASLVHGVVHNAAKAHKNPGLLLDHYFKSSREDFLSGLVGETWATKLIKHCGKRWDDMIEDNVGSVLQVAYAHDWDKWEARLEVPPPKKSKARNVLADAVDLDILLEADRIMEQGRAHNLRPENMQGLNEAFWNAVPPRVDNIRVARAGQVNMQGVRAENIIIDEDF